jgi:ADP-ribose pyrophosphatase YjhB (NUDIX family)
MSLLTSAVAAVIRDPAGHILLCRQSGGHRMWSLPGGNIRPGESPIHAAIRDIREETGAETEIVDLVGIYQLSGGDLPSVEMYVFRGQVADADLVLNAPGRICALTWHEPDLLPEPLTATGQAAIADVLAGRSGVLRAVRRATEPDTPDAEEGVEITAIAELAAAGTTVLAT